jgi:acetoin utilization deacetylase AcuC-like enzyme
MEQLEIRNILERVTLVTPSPATPADISLVHDSGYIERVRMACERGDRFLDSLDTGIGHESYRVAMLAAGGGLEAIRQVMEGKIHNAFCAVRPPGHHAEKTQALGFCIFNNIAVAARYAQREYGLKKTMIIDWDVHHGNGTQHTFYEDSSVYYISTHQYPHYPGTGKADERGSEKGLGFTMNFPLPPGTDD